MPSKPSPDGGEVRALYDSDQWQVVYPVSTYDAAGNMIPGPMRDAPEDRWSIDESTRQVIDDPMRYIDTDDPDQIQGFRDVNRDAKVLYDTILRRCPRSAERTIAIRKLQEARMWANAAIVFDGRTYTT